MDKLREFPFTDQDFEILRELARRHAGIALPPAKKDMVYNRIARRLRALGLDNFGDYCRLVAGGDGPELVNFTNSITTNLTAFFRETHHFAFLADRLLPELLQNRPRGRRIRIWSAGCSTGEEPYSIAMVLLERLPPRETWDAKILASDVDSSVLAAARAGIYGAERIAEMAPQRVRRWFLRGTGTLGGTVRISPALAKLVFFRELNLLHEWPFRGPFDCIFCRNVVIYFDKPTQRALFERYAQLLPDDGHLFIGHSESLFQMSDRFELVGQSIYRKVR